VSAFVFQAEALFLIGKALHMAARRFLPPFCLFPFAWAALVCRGCLCQKDNVWLPFFFFLPSPFSQKNFSKKTSPPPVILPVRGEVDDLHSIANTGRHRSDRGADT
jgi:hypothetical protein